MSGGSIPYHLRTNKAIDRQIFFEILNQLKLPEKIQKYKYISLGGPMLEDHHILHHSLGITNLESLERDTSVFSRQNFNKNYGCISCRNTTIESFINEFNRNESTVIWLDYTDTSWAQQFTECHDILEKLDEYDIFKVTFNANPDALVDSSGMGKDKVDVFKKKSACKFLNENITKNDVEPMDRFASTICGIFQTVADSALDFGDDLSLHPVTIFRYIDNKHQMLSITGIILKKTGPQNIKALLNDSHLDVQPHICSSWNDIHEINVPDLTFRERFEINKLLPISENEIDVDALPFRLDSNGKRAKKAIDNYVKYYRYIPNFQRLAF